MTSQKTDQRDDSLNIKKKGRKIQRIWMILFLPFFWLLFWLLLLMMMMKTTTTNDHPVTETQNVKIWSFPMFLCFKVQENDTDPTEQTREGIDDVVFLYVCHSVCMSLCVCVCVYVWLRTFALSLQTYRTKTTVHQKNRPVPTSR